MATVLSIASHERRGRLEGRLSGTDLGDMFYLTRQAERGDRALFDVLTSLGQLLPVNSRRYRCAERFARRSAQFNR